MAKFNGQSVNELYYLLVNICTIDDLDHDRYSPNKFKTTFNMSDRLFTYQTKDNKVKLIIDLETGLNNQSYEEANVLCITDLINDENSEIRNMIIHPIFSDRFTYLNGKKIYTIKLPCLGFRVSKISEETQNDDIERIERPSIRTIDKLEVDFFKWNPENSEILLIFSGSLISIWNVNSNHYRSLDLSTKDEWKKLQSVVVDADWNFAGSHFTVTFKNKDYSSDENRNFFHSIIFDANINALALFEEDRCEKVLLLEYSRVEDIEKFYVFTLGRKENTNEFKYGMCRIKTTPVNII